MINENEINPSNNKVISMVWLLTPIVIASALIMLLSGYVKYDDVDLSSGRVRTQRAIFGITISSVESETDFSNVLQKKDSPSWVHDSSSCIFNQTSPHYKYHGSISEIQIPSIIISESNLSRQEQASIFERILVLLKDRRFSEIDSILQETQNRRK